jgi:hypothetical protein
MRELTGHKLTGLNEALRIEVLDEPGSGGACHSYRFSWTIEAGHGLGFHQELRFQKGPIAEAGVNGLSNEALLAVLIDRMQGFQSGEFKCRENAVALTKLEEAMMWLQKRTRDRMARGVEGTSQK